MSSFFSFLISKKSSAKNILSDICKILNKDVTSTITVHCVNVSCN